MTGVAQVGPTETPVLITGDTGVGKEIIANKIHDASLRRTKPFKVINCSVFPDNGLLQSEIFWTRERGIYRGQRINGKVWFEQADTGTLFFDEIGEMSAEVQVKFLRVLEDQEFTRLGGNRVI